MVMVFFYPVNFLRTEHYGKIFLYKTFFICEAKHRISPKMPHSPVGSRRFMSPNLTDITEHEIDFIRHEVVPLKILLHI